jgi:hypothetical protein
MSLWGRFTLTAKHYTVRSMIKQELNGIIAHENESSLKHRRPFYRLAGNGDVVMAKARRIINRFR